MTISKCSNLICCKKGRSKSRFNVFLSPFVAYKAKFRSVYTVKVWWTSPTVIVFGGRIPWIFDHLSAHMIATASKLTTTKSFVDSCLPWATPKYYYIGTISAQWILESLQRGGSLFVVTQCGRSILGGRGKAMYILKRNRLEHTILLKEKK